jgi:ribosome-binding factor A
METSIKRQEVLRRLAATFLETQSNRTSLISVTRVDLLPNGSQLVIYVSVLPEDQEIEALNFLKRQRKELKEYIKKHSSIRRIPFIDIELDYGEKNRQALDKIK